MEEVQQIVTFSNDAAVIPEHFPAEQVLPNQANDQHEDSIDHSIISYLQRPQRIDSYLWRKTLRIGKLLSEGSKTFKYDIPALGLTRMALNKLDGLTSFRATAVVRIQFNSQPFQQGRLILAAIPMPYLIGERADWLSTHPSLLQSINHVQVDISKQTEATLRIPFVSPFNSFDLIVNKYQWARCVCMVYSALQDPLNVGVPVQVWIHFEDIVLGTATSGIYNSMGEVVAHEQAGGVKRDPAPSAVRQNREAEETGKVSSTIASVGRGIGSVADTVGGALPFLSPITGAVSSIAKTGSSIVEGLGSLFGFSKPQPSYSGYTVLQRPCEGFGNSNGVDHSHVLGLDRLNNVDVYPGLGGTSFDEQDINYLTRIPQFIDQFIYTNKSTYDQVLWTSYVSPTYYIPGSMKLKAPLAGNCAAGIDELQPTILNYVSSFFVYWTGSLVYTFRFVKTDFHSGRVEISFHPFTNGVATDRINYAYRAVVDLRDTTEVSLSVPFVSPQPWKRLIPANPLDAGNWEAYGSCATGRLQVRAITPLILSSAVVTNEVHCVIEVRAGDDYRLQAPVSSTYLQFTPARGSIGFHESEVPNQLPKEHWYYPKKSVPEVTDNKVRKKRSISLDSLSSDSDLAYEQSGPIALPGTAETRTTAIEGFSPKSITTSSLDTHRTDTQRYCAGEVFENYRALTRKFAFVRKGSQIKTYQNSLTISAAPYVRAPRLSWDAWYYSANGTTAYAPVFQFEWGHSNLSQIGSMYAFYRGGIRFKIFTSNVKKLISGRCVNKYDITYPYADGKQYSTDQVFQPYNANIAYELPEQKGFAEFQLPFYSPVMLAVPGDIQRMAEFDQSACALNISFYSSDPEEKTDVHIAVAASDDMTFHTFVGLNPVITKLRFQRLLTKIDCDQVVLTTTPFSQVGYRGSHSNADPCYDVTRIVGNNWQHDDNAGETWLGMESITVDVPDIQGNGTTVRNNNRRYF